MSRWVWTYKGAFDGNSQTERTQPSWSSFDHYAWTRTDGYKLELTQNTKRRRGLRPLRYKVRVFNAVGDLKGTWFGDSWQKLVKKVKAELQAQERSQLVGGAAAVLTSDALAQAYLKLSTEERQEFSKKVWADVLEVFGIK